MPLILGAGRKQDAAYLEACRVKRNTVEYDYVNGASENDAEELISFVREFRDAVSQWLENNYLALS